MTRKAWKNLDGLWDYTLSDATAEEPPQTYPNKILVPFPYESSLSGVGKPSPTQQRLWYRRRFSVPAGWPKDDRILLHLGAVNWDSSVFVNGKSVGRHRGGYTGFNFDITDYLSNGANQLVISAWNPLFHDDPQAQVLGKQREKPVSVLYTASTGIWQTVWLEPVPPVHISDIKITPSLKDHAFLVTANSAVENVKTQVTIIDAGRVVGKGIGVTRKPISIPLPNPHLWSPQDPHLYQIRVTLLGARGGTDTVNSYGAMREIALGKNSKGRIVMLLNGAPYFQVGVLDQGYWPDGLYTAPTDEALRFDIEAAKKLGFNLIRKHAKVEPDRWYYWADTLGLLVWQDMPQMFGDENQLSQEAKEQFRTELLQMIKELYDHPCIVVWTDFNENWGQHDTEAIAALTKLTDPTRLVNAASGGVYYLHNGKRGGAREDLEAGIGDIIDQHDYPEPTHVRPDATRAAVTGEFGGVTMEVDMHRWTQRVFAYGSVLRGSWFFTRRYQELLKQAWAIKEEFGTSAVVYTQLTDVEAEINGLITYDREIFKPDVSIVADANRDIFPPMPPNPNVQIVPITSAPAREWRVSDTEQTGWSSKDFDSSSWHPEAGPVITDQPQIWMRSTFVLAEHHPSSLSLETTSHARLEVYINGVFAGSIRGSRNESLTLQSMTPAALASLSPGENNIALTAMRIEPEQTVDLGITQDNR